MISLIDAEIGKTYIIVDIPQLDPHETCKPCIRLRMMEMGFYEKQKISLLKHQHGIWLIALLSIDGMTESVIAMRDEELERIIIEKI